MFGENAAQINNTSSKYHNTNASEVNSWTLPAAVLFPFILFRDCWNIRTKASGVSRERLRVKKTRAPSALSSGTYVRGRVVVEIDVDLSVFAVFLENYAALRTEHDPFFAADVPVLWLCRRQKIRAVDFPAFGMSILPFCWGLEYIYLSARFLFGHRPKCFSNDRKKLCHFGQNVWKYRIMDTVAANFNTTVRQMIEMFQWPKCPSKKMTEISQWKQTPGLESIFF